MSEFNKNQADIISYRPDLKMEFVPSLNPTFEDKVNESINDIKSERIISIALSEFEEYKPSLTLTNMDDLLSNIREYKSFVRDKLSDTDVGKEYLSAKDEYKKKEIIDNNYDSVNGTTYLESLVELQKIEDEVSEVRELYSNATYGEDIGNDRAIKIDDDFIDKLSILENENDTDNINYTCLYFETMISNIMKSYCFRLLDEGVGGLAGITDFHKTMPFNDKYSKILVNNFQKNQEILKNDISKDKKTAYNVRVALKNAFLAIQEYEDSLEAISSANLLTEDSGLALELKRDGLASLSTALSELTILTMYSTMSKNDIASTLAKKSNVRGYFLESL